MDMVTYGYYIVGLIFRLIVNFKLEIVTFDLE